MNKCIVTTSINALTPALKKFDELEGWHLIVIGDKKTPDIKLKHGDYVPPRHQNSLGFASVPHIPWNLIQRRFILMISR